MEGSGGGALKWVRRWQGGRCGEGERGGGVVVEGGGGGGVEGVGGGGRGALRKDSRIEMAFRIGPARKTEASNEKLVIIENIETEINCKLLKTLKGFYNFVFLLFLPFL